MRQLFSRSALAGMLTLSAFNVAAFGSFTVEKIEIQGLERISEGTVYNYLPLEVGQQLDDRKSDEVIRTLFKTGFFQDVSLSQSKNTLVIHVKERPAIGQIKISGNKEIKTEDMLKGLKEAGLAEGRTFDASTLDAIEQDLRRQYYAHGQYGVKLTVSVEDQPRNRVSVKINIEEGPFARIKDITIVGNKAYPQSTLISQFNSSATNLLSWFTKDDRYIKQKLANDLESIRSYYMDRGYLDFKIKSSTVSLSVDKSSIFITIVVQEGQQYKVDSIKISGDMVVGKEELIKEITVEPEEIFSRAKVSASMKALSAKLGQHGYTFARINPMPEIIPGDVPRVRINFHVESGKRTYINQIRFQGNNKTQDKVLRREMDLDEGGVASTKALEESRTRLNRSGYFESVEISTDPVPGKPDLVDVLFKVKETNSGEIGGGLGYSDSEGLMFNANVKNRNYLGSGNTLDFVFNHSKTYTTYNINYNNPYYTPDGVSRGFTAYYSKTDNETAQISDYNTDAYGGTVSFGLPLSPWSRFTITGGAQNTKLTTSTRNRIPQEIQLFVQNHGRYYDEATLALSWTFNSLDRFMFPENGAKHGLSFYASLPGSDIQYYKIAGSVNFYNELKYGFIFMTKANAEFGNGYNQTKNLPFFKNSFGGGAKTVRGYKENTLGPKDTNGMPFGGNLSFNGSLALAIPNWFSEGVPSMRTSLFIDAGQVYDTEHRRYYLIDGRTLERNPTGIRSSAGISLTWVSPLGPLVFNLAKPLKRYEGDKLQTFAFNFGTTF